MDSNINMAPYIARGSGYILVYICTCLAIDLDLDVVRYCFARSRKGIYCMYVYVAIILASSIYIYRSSRLATYIMYIHVTFLLPFRYIFSFFSTCTLINCACNFNFKRISKGKVVIGKYLHLATKLYMYTCVYVYT